MHRLGLLLWHGQGGRNRLRQEQVLETLAGCWAHEGGDATFNDVQELLNRQCRVAECPHFPAALPQCCFAYMTKQEGC